MAYVCYKYLHDFNPIYMPRRGVILFIHVYLNCKMSIHNFTHRHVGPREKELEHMLTKTGDANLDNLIEKTIPSSIRLTKGLNIGPGMSENEYLRYIWQIASQNEVFRTYIGMGYYNTYSPSPIVRNILENPSWYTSYTPYQAEISQGRLEALLNFQTMVTELTGLPIANASLLDEATAAAEAMVMFYNNRNRDQVKFGSNMFFVDERVFPQTLAVLQTRAIPLGIEVKIENYATFKPEKEFFGALVQYPDADGCVRDYKDFAARCREGNLQLAVSADLMSLVLLVPPGQWGADVVVGSSQRFGISMGYGGPHAAFFAAREEYKRAMPGRIIGVSVDARGERALRMALQTREQHIKRERATSNICTAQALLASMAGMYAVYHGPEGLKEIASGIHANAVWLSQGLSEIGYVQENKVFFDTLKVRVENLALVDKIRELALDKRINLKYFKSLHVGISLDETVRNTDVKDLLGVFAEAMGGESRVPVLLK
jgi:glycine dehydrogenase